MARIARLIVPGCPHHAVHRANRGETLFATDARCQLYRRWLREYAAENDLQVWAYCLMANHVHLIVVPTREDSLARAIGQTHMRYSRWLNRGRGEGGHVWANRFYSAPMDDAHLWEALKYVELNPVRAGLAVAAEEYPWSSAPAHVRATPDVTLSGGLPLGLPPVGHEWAEWLRAGVPEASLSAIRNSTSTGRPLGSREFVARLEAQAGRRLAPRRPGPRGRE
jgi:putative transposase